MKHRIEDLGPKATGNLWRAYRMVRDPRTKLQYIMGALTRTGFALIDPRTRSSRVIRCEHGMTCAEGIAQAPSGDLYVADYGHPNPRPTLCRWDWKGDTARAVASAPWKGVMHMDADAAGDLFLPDYTRNILMRFRSATGKLEELGDFAEFGNHVRNVEGGADGWLYLQIYVNQPGVGSVATLLALDPRTNRRTRIDASAIAPAEPDAGVLLKDANGRVLVSTVQWGQRVWHELKDARVQRIDPALVALTPNHQPMAFDDGSYIASIVDRTVTLVDANRQTTQFEIEREEAPLRIFSVASGGGKIWCGTFMPLTLASYDPKTNESRSYGNVTRTEGEPYSMVYSNHKLYMACYVNGHVVRFDPAMPFVKNDTIQSNPGTLGLMKPTGLPVHRPHGKTIDPQGNVYFAALGGYGCIDSAITKIDPRTDRMLCWIYPNTEFTAIVHHEKTGLLLVAERRHEEKWLRITRVSAADGAVVDSTPVIEDGGEIHSLLIDNAAGVAFGVHGYRATLFKYDLEQKKIAASLPEMRVGTHLHNVLVDGPDGRVWGVTTTSVFAATRDLRSVETLGTFAEFPDAGNRFGACFGDDGHLYFANGPSLMRLRIER